MKPGRKPASLTFRPFQARGPGLTYSTATVRLARCNKCGAFQVFPYSEHVVENGVVVDTVDHPGIAITHQPGCPLAEAAQE
jgi:hypothetical protein